MIVSAPLLSTGVPLWVMGHNKQRANKAARPKALLQVVPELGQERRGIRLVGSF
ncbi:MAG: hypothetical protein H6734_23195 [Alphaproteobacteria bacterium]|nr:hypothetical protein [Alphaproteobacteria bacterium]